MENIFDFDPIRPYRDDEIHRVFERLTREQRFLKLLQFLFPNVPTDAFVAKLMHISSIREFQSEVIYPFVRHIIQTTTQGLTSSGLDRLDPKKQYLFISNHRDIVLDPAILNIVLHEHGFETTEIAIGDNLLIYPWITDLVKLNKTFIVKRNIPVRQMMEASTLLSNYIRQAITRRGQNIWIAQREGRSKDGDDRTQVSLLKMLNISGSVDMESDFKELNIVPVSISYEYDPCDYLKAYEFQMKRDVEGYQKTQNDDLNHMATGLRGRKGRVHFAFGTPLSGLGDILKGAHKNEQLALVAEKIDGQIHDLYRLWPGNFLAHDILHGNQDYRKQYTDEDKVNFMEYIHEHISRIESDEEFIFQTLMEMYANPVINFHAD